jgi:glycosyltransferase involved in cell wall biosynthesis
LSLVPNRVRLRLVGYETIGYPTYGRELLAEASRLGVQDRLEILPAASRHALLQISADQHVGVALMPRVSDDINMRHMVGASNKATDYLAAGLALLVSDLPDWRAAYVDARYGLSCDPSSARSIAAALKWFLDHRNETLQMGERGRQRLVSEWNYDAVFEPILAGMSGGTASNK